MPVCPVILSEGSITPLGSIFKALKVFFLQQTFIRHLACSRHSVGAGDTVKMEGNHTDTVSIKFLTNVTTAGLEEHQSGHILTFITGHNPSERLDS